MKAKLYWIILVIAAIIIVGLFVIRIFFHVLDGFELGNISDAATAIIAIAAAIATACEYNRHEKESKVLLFSKMNKVYVQDESIQAVVTHLNQREASAPTINQIELFFRFFEELEEYITNGVLSEDIVYRLFAYYCLEPFRANGSDESKAILKRIEFDKYEGSWSNLVSFVNRMRNYEIEVKGSSNIRKFKDTNS